MEIAGGLCLSYMLFVVVVVVVVFDALSFASLSFNCMDVCE